MAINYEQLVTNIVKPLVLHPQNISCIVSYELDANVLIRLLVDPVDIGRVVGKQGKVANSIRTILYAGATREGQKVTLEIFPKEN